MARSILTFALFPVTLALASCNSAATGDNAPTASPAPQGAIQGETVALDGGLPFLATSFGQFDEPWAIALEPGTNTIFITEKGGTAKFYQPASGKQGNVTGLPQVAYGGQGGLGDFAFAPDYATSSAVYLTWAKQAEGDKRRAVLGRARLVCEDGTSCELRDLREIWQQSVAVDSNGHFSHKIAFAPDGTHIFLSSGDRQQQTPAQDLSNNLGSIVRLNLDGTPAAGNPLADENVALPDIWSYGHRNALGLQFDASGNLWDLEHGPRGGDELNLVKGGQNYGWPVRSDGINYNGDPIPDHSPDDGFTKPAISWNPVIAPGDFLFYRGNLWPWTGEAIIANLGTQTIVRVKTDPAANRAEEVARYKFPKRLRDIAEAPDGSLWVIEDGGNARLMHLTPAG